MRGSEEFGPVSELAKLRDGILGQPPTSLAVSLLFFFQARIICTLFIFF